MTKLCKTAYGIGIVVTNAEISSYYAATTANFAIGYDYTNPGYDICFMGDATGANWKAIDVATIPTSITAEKAKPFYLDKNPGKILPIILMIKQQLPAVRRLLLLTERLLIRLQFLPQLQLR